MSAAFLNLQEFNKHLKIINTHCHHLPDIEHQHIGLDFILNKSYVSWCKVDYGDTFDKKSEFLRLVRFNAYFHWLEKALCELCGISQNLTAENWSIFDEKIQQLHQNENYHLEILQDRCGYEKIILDPYWNPGSNEGHPGYFTPTYRINMFLYGYNTQAQDHNGNNPYTVYGWESSLTFDEYLAKMKEQIKEHIQSGCVAMKSALAYDRGLDFCETDKEKAKRGFLNPNANAEDIKAFQDYVFFEICNIAAEYNVPLQCHTGLGKLEKSNAMQMQEVIEKNPQTRFVLFHGSYPWIQDLCALIHNYPNVYADICWLPIISGNACETLLKELIEVGTTDRITWGCDTWTSEESFGALLAAKQVVAKVFAEYIDNFYLSLVDAQEFNRQIFYENAKNLYFKS
jgi:hypothetical protein